MKFTNDHEQLLEDFDGPEFIGNILILFWNYSCCLLNEKNENAARIIEHGVSQGTVVGLTLFNIHMYDILVSRIFRETFS